MRRKVAKKHRVLPDPKFGDVQVTVFVNSLMKDGKKRLIHFGDASMKDFTQHKDPARRKNYLARSGGIKNKAGKLTKNDKNSANYWSRKINW